MAGQSTVEVVVVPAMDSSVTSLGIVSAPFGALHTVVASVCWVMGTQLTVAQRPSATIMEVLDGKERAHAHQVEALTAAGAVGVDARGRQPVAQRRQHLAGLLTPVDAQRLAQAHRRRHGAEHERPRRPAGAS